LIFNAIKINNFFEKFLRACLVCVPKFRCGSAGDSSFPKRDDFTGAYGMKLQQRTGSNLCF
jgi:hypothetical protein